MKYLLLIGSMIILLLVCFQAISGNNNFANGMRSDCGDVNSDSNVNIIDITFLISYLYMGGPPPADTLAADVNNTGGINILDITYLIGYLYQGGPLPDCPISEPEPDSLPATYDLRNIEGNNYVTGVRSQSGGTCWAHATMASAESNLLMTANWANAGEAGEPDLAEYHLDWWNGFNDFWDPDSDPYSDVIVHEGGTFQMSAAYFTRGDGAIRDIDAPSFSAPAEHYDDSYHYFYVRDIEWYSCMHYDYQDTAQSRISFIKQKVMEQGGVAVGMNTDYIEDDYTCYTPEDGFGWLNHTVLVVGWDNSKITAAPQPGAWLCKNSWGGGWGIGGYFWISYYDFHCGRNATLGAVSFLNVEPMIYDNIYFYDYHGWGYHQYTYEAFNAYTAISNDKMMAVNFVTLADSVDYTITIYDAFDGVNLSGELSTVSGMIEIKGYHTVDLTEPLLLERGNDFYINLQLSDDKMAYDYSHYVANIPGAKSGAFLKSKSEPKQSYFRSDKGWADLYDVDRTANFCIKGLAVSQSLKTLPSEDFVLEGPRGGPFVPPSKSYKLTHKYDDPINYEITINPAVEWLIITGSTSGSLAPADTIEISFEIDESKTLDLPEGLYNVDILFDNLSNATDDHMHTIAMSLGTPTVQYEWLLDSDPGWVCEGDWAFGSPTGGGGSLGFGTDPVGGATGANVYGYLIDGNYPDELSETHLTTGPIDCSLLLKTKLNYQRWLAADGFGHGYVRISTNGTEWTTIWSGYDGVNGIDWIDSEMDISAYADFQPTVYLRWTMIVEGGPMYLFGGWNIDDVRVLGIFDSTMVMSVNADQTFGNE